MRKRKRKGFPACWAGGILAHPGASAREWARQAAQLAQQRGRRRGTAESAFIPFVSFGDLDNNTFKGLTSLLSVEQEIRYDEHT
jgi:hypothetical protein